jgi:biopolymer transport protein ExbB/TolQ
MRRVFLAALVILFSLATFGLQAQTLDDIGIPSEDVLAPSGVESAAADDLPTFNAFDYAGSSFAGSGGIFMWAILIVALLGLIIAVERIYNLVFRFRTDKVKVYSRVVNMIREGRVDAAKEYLRDQQTPLTNVMYSAVNKPYGTGEADIQKAVDEAFLSEYPRIHRNLGYLATIANVSTLLGLLGTIFGLIMAFFAVSNVPAAKRTQALAVGIQVAMATTAFGLVVAIPTLVIHGWLSAQAEKVVSDIDEMSVRIVNFLSEKG